MKLLFVFLTLMLCPDALSSTLERIDVEGLSRTHPDVIRSEFPMSPGDTYSEDLKNEGVTRLKNMGIFSKVEVTTETNDDKTIIKVLAEDRWTTIPIAKFASGGGVSQIILGVFDPNLFGRYKEAGAQYEKLGEATSGVLWFKNPRLFGNRTELFAQIWQNNRIRRKYFQEQIDPELKLGFLHTRRKYYLELAQELTWWFKAGVLIEQHNDTFSDKYLEEELLELVKTMGLPPDTKVQFYGLNLQFGRLNSDTYLVDGIKGEAFYKHGNHVEKEFTDFDQIELNAVAMKTVFGDHTIAQRVMFGGTSTKTLQYWHYLGGLDRVRGFADNRFAGRYFWLSNTEYRLPVYRSGSLVVQTNLFHDVAAIGEEMEDLDKATGASVGGGLRFIAPKIYRLVARLDFAKAIVKRDEIPISFGVQQFF